ncbi:hypothetical protein ACJX0J_035597 [Zea mays]
MTREQSGKQSNNAIKYLKLKKQVLRLNFLLFSKRWKMLMQCSIDHFTFHMFLSKTAIFIMLYFNAIKDLVCLHEKMLAKLLVGYSNMLCLRGVGLMDAYAIYRFMFYHIMHEYMSRVKSNISIVFHINIFYNTKNLLFNKTYSKMQNEKKIACNKKLHVDVENAK